MASRRSTEGMVAGVASDAAAEPRGLSHGIALALQDPTAGRAELLAAARRCDVLGAAASVVFIGIADDDYAGFEDAARAVNGMRAALERIDDPADALLGRAAALMAGWFEALDDPALPGFAAAIETALRDPTLGAPLRCCAALVALGYRRARMDLDGVLWLELALRPVLADPALSDRLAGEAMHALVQALYECAGQAEPRAAALRASGRAGTAAEPAIRLKLLLLDAQMALGAGQAEAGRSALSAAEPLLDPRAPRPASWWHLLRSRLDLLEGRERRALGHARLALRLGSESCLPERWMGVTVMQEGQVLMAGGAYAQAVPFFERAGRAASGSQARFCWCLVHLARALDHLGAQRNEAARSELCEGLAIARELAWLHFFRACPRVAAEVCSAALEYGVEAPFVREVIGARALQSLRPALADWPWAVRVRTLGALQIELDGRDLVFKGKVAKKPLELLLFIVASGGSDISVGGAAFALWRDLDGDKARSALTIALHRLRKLLASDDAVRLELGRLSLDPRIVWVDCLAFEQLVASVGTPSADALGAPARAAAERALALYAGAFLHDAEDEAWQIAYRSRLAAKFKRTVSLLAHAARARGDDLAAQVLLERGIEFDPLAEDLARELMRLLIERGEQAAALAVFERCRTAIGEGLGATPAPATLALLAHIRSAGSTGSTGATVG